MLSFIIKVTELHFLGVHFVRGSIEMIFRGYLDALDGYHRDIELYWDYCVATGYTGRDQEGVRRHIEELERIGIAAPYKIPAMYWIDPERVTSADVLYVIGEKTSGEIEFFLASDRDGDLYFTVASDHTDRELESVSIAKAKQICSKIISPCFWRLADIRDHWDEIRLKMEVSVNGFDFSVYQEGFLGQILPPERLFDLAKGDVLKSGAIISIFSGTLPLKSQSFVYAECYKLSMEDPVLSRAIRKKYNVQILPDRS